MFETTSLACNPSDYPSHAFQIFRHPPCLSDMPIYKGYFGQDKNIHTGFYGVYYALKRHIKRKVKKGK